MCVLGVYPMKNSIKQIFKSKDFIEYNKWFLKADWKNIKIKNLEDDANWLIWDNGTWYDGIWRNGVWHDGTWYDGIWASGIWYNGMWFNGTWKYGKWHTGMWLKGKWQGGTWKSGKIYNSKTDKYEISKISPNKCPWSLSYEK